MTNRRLIGIAIAVLALVAVAVLNSGAGLQTETTSGGVTESEAFESVRFSDLPVISVFELPPEALDTLDLIDQGGPYPFQRDDLTFENREGLLPDRSRGHYREYTVITPGEDDRGARRIVAGADGERYYTADHYRSFNEVLYDR